MFKNLILAIMILGCILPAGFAGADEAASMPADMQMEGMDHSMHGNHMAMTSPQKAMPGDQARADKIVETLRSTLVKYSDYHVALNDGYKIFHPNIRQEQYHFTNYSYAFWARFTFDPSMPTSLLYRKTATGYKLIGAMYTAPRNATDDQLNARVPLSVARWHRHINLCLPPSVQDPAKADWTRFGLRGSIDTEDACKKAGGRWMPQVFGWMVHVYPFEKDADKVWPH